MTPPTDLWHQFKNAFTGEMRELDDGALRKLWRSQAKRTEGLTNTILKNVAKGFRLDFESEFLNVDFCLSENSVPKIFIESENIAKTAHSEIRKLACLSTPLKVLITVSEWSDRWRHGGNRKNLTNEWSQIIMRHHGSGISVGKTGVIVGEWHQDTLRFYAFLFGTDGQVEEPEAVIFEKIIVG